MSGKANYVRASCCTALFCKQVMKLPLFPVEWIHSLSEMKGRWGWFSCWEETPILDFRFGSQWKETWFIFQTFTSVSQASLYSRVLKIRKVIFVKESFTDLFHFPDQNYAYTLHMEYCSWTRFLIIQTICKANLSRTRSSDPESTNGFPNDLNAMYHWNRIF
jgi:hypothetical protein